MNDKRNHLGKRLTTPVGRVLCMLGVHDFRVLELRFGIGRGNNIEKVECRRCGRNSIRRS